MVGGVTEIAPPNNMCLLHIWIGASKKKVISIQCCDAGTSEPEIFF